MVNGSGGEKQSGDKSLDYPIFISHFQGNKTQNRYHKILTKDESPDNPYFFHFQGNKKFSLKNFYTSQEKFYSPYGDEFS